MRIIASSIASATIHIFLLVFCFSFLDVANPQKNESVLIQKTPLSIRLTHYKEKQNRKVEIKKKQKPEIKKPESVKKEIENVAEFFPKQEKKETKKAKKVSASFQSIMTLPAYKKTEPPVYPKLAKKRNYEGVVILDILVNKDGKPQDIKIAVSCTYDILDKVAIKAVKKWFFEPATKGGKPIEARVKVPVHFKLTK